MDQKKAYDLITHGKTEPVGYRLLVKPLDAKREMEARQAEEFPLLAQSGFETKTATQEERESRGMNWAIVVAIGQTAFDRLGAPWVEVGDVVIFHRYSGERTELPPGSGDFYQFVNDEDIFGRMRED